ncbi:MAG: hypothetical protein HDS12_01180 [Bacteroides sp.]|nr:hypothetical protein [Bacteroides sp.]
MDKENRGNTGWIALSRAIQHHWIWEEPRRLKMWIRLLFLAKYEDDEIMVGNKRVIVKRGQFTSTTRNLSGLFGCAKQTAQNFIVTLEAHNMIQREKFNRYTLFTIVNYDFYQLGENLGSREHYETSKTIGRKSAHIEEIKNKENSSLSSSRENFEKLCLELKEDSLFWQTTATALKATVNSLREPANDFFRERMAKHDFPETSTELRSHLFNWLRKNKEIRKEKEEKKAPAAKAEYKKGSLRDSYRGWDPAPSHPTSYKCNRRFFP